MKKRKNRSNIFFNIGSSDVMFGPSYTGRSRLLRLYGSLVGSLAIFLASTALLLTIISISSDIPEVSFSKDLKFDIQKIIKNGGDLGTVKHVYNSRRIVKRKLSDVFLKETSEYYPAGTSLNEVLADLKADYFRSPARDSTFLVSLDRIMELNNQVNPFDKLESHQKFAFENVRDKLDSNYVVVQEDLHRIADQLDNRNTLVDQYLDKSTLSYWISVIALVVTILLSTFQLYQNRTNRISNLLRTILESKEPEAPDDVLPEDPST